MQEVSFCATGVLIAFNQANSGNGGSAGVGGLNGGSGGGGDGGGIESRP